MLVNTAAYVSQQTASEVVPFTQVGEHFAVHKQPHQNHWLFVWV